MANRIEAFKWGRLDFSGCNFLSYQAPLSLLEILALDEAFMPQVLETHIKHGQAPSLLFALPESRFDDFGRATTHLIDDIKIQEVSRTLRGELRRPLEFAYDLKLSRKEFSLNQDKTLLFEQNLLASLDANLHEDEEVIFSCILDGTLPAQSKSDYMLDPRFDNAFSRLLGTAPIASDEMREAVEARYTNRSFLAQIKVGIITDEGEERVWEIERLIKSSLEYLSTKFTRVSLSNSIDPKDITLVRPPKKLSHCLNLCPAEVLPFLFLPIEKVRIPNSVPAPSKQLSPPNGYNCREEVAFGKSVDKYNSTYLNMLPDNYSRHLIINGRSGGGKSTLGVNHLIRLANAGESIVVFDPKGDIHRQLYCALDPYIVEKAKIVNIDLADTSPTLVPTNPFSPIWKMGASKEAVSDNIINAIEKAAGGYWGHMMDDVISCAIKTLTYYVDRPTIPMLVPLLTDKDFRKPIVDKVIRQDPYGLGGFWKSYEEMSKLGQAKTTESSMRRLREFTTRETLRTMLGVAEPKFDLSEIFTPNQQVIVVFTCNSGAGGSRAVNLINSLAISQIWSSAQAQSRIEEASRKRVHLFVDEAGDNVNLNMPFDEMCAQARGYNLCLTLIYQYKDQLGGSLDSAENNASTHISFGSNQAKECRALAEQFGNGLEAHDFQDLPQHHFYMSTIFRGERVVFSGQTLPIPKEVKVNPYDVLRKSRESYGVDKSKTMEEAFGLPKVQEKLEGFLKILHKEEVADA